MSYAEFHECLKCGLILIGGLSLVLGLFMAMLHIMSWLEDVNWAIKQVQPLIDRVNEHGEKLPKAKKPRSA